MFDFSDKRLMQTVRDGSTGPSPSAASSGSGSPGTTDEVVERAFNQALDNAKTGEDVTRITAERDRYRAGKETGVEVAKSAGKAGLDNQIKALGDINAGVIQQGIKAADAETANQKQAFLNLIMLYDQSTKNLMANENSIETMKANISGMLKLVGIIAKKFGADEFAQGCLDLAEDLKPQLISPNIEGVKAMEEIAEKYHIDNETLNRIITGQSATVNQVIKSAQPGIDASRDQAVTGTQEAQYVGPTGVIKGNAAPAAAPAPASGISKSSFAASLDNLLTDRGNGIILATEIKPLNKAFEGIAAKGGKTDQIDTPTERLSLEAVIRANVASKPAENKLISSLGLEAPRPGKDSGF